MTDISAIRPAILPDTSVGAEPRSYWSTVAERLSRDRVTLAVGGVLLCIILLAVFAPWAATHDPLQGSVLRRLRSALRRGSQHPGLQRQRRRSEDGDRRRA